MNFSSEMDDIGKFQIKKLFELLRIILAIYKYRLFHNVKVLYYPPAGPNTTPILRDICILLATRFLFKKTIFHFHAGGISEKYSDLPLLIQKAFKWAYYYPDLTIRLSTLNPEDGKFLRSKRDVVIPYGIEDCAEKLKLEKVSNTNINILFTGLVKESKGATILLKTTDLLVKRGYNDIIVSLMGKFESKEYEQELRNFVSDKNLVNNVRFLGVKSGADKFVFFNQCDIFCFPTFFESETFGIVILEAMQFAKPVIATRWRGIPDIIRENENGLLVDPKDEVQLADALEKLILDKDIRREMGESGRKRFSKNYSTEIFKQNLYSAFRNCSE